MFITENHKNTLENLFNSIKLKNYSSIKSSAQENKINQIFSYLEVIDAQIRKISSKRKLVLVDFAAGNCYLSFLVYHYYNVMKKREIEIHCVDNNLRLMDNTRKTAMNLDFKGMFFHACDILDFTIAGNVDISYSLHACDTATDKALFMGLQLKAPCILSVTCCQHSLKKNYRNRMLNGVSHYKSFKDKLLYIIADSMRAQLLEMQGYKIDIFNFTSSRNTDKNTMIRARDCGRNPSPNISENYTALRRGFNIHPLLEDLMNLYQDKGFKRKSVS